MAIKQPDLKYSLKEDVELRTIDAVHEKLDEDPGWGQRAEVQRELAGILAGLDRIEALIND